MASECPYGLCDGRGYLWVKTERYPEGAFQECRCAKERRDKAAAERLLAEAGLKLSDLDRYAFEAFHPEKAVASAAGRRDLVGITERMKAYAAEPGGWIVLMGPYGCGKTHLAYAVVRYMATAGRAVYYGSTPDILDALRRGFDCNGGMDYDKRLKTMQEVPLLVLDDLGTEHQTPWVAEKLFQIVNFRYTRRLPMVITTNVPITEGAPIDPRIRSRLLDRSLCEILAMPAGDYRRQAA